MLTIFTMLFTSIAFAQEAGQSPVDEDCYLKAGEHKVTLTGIGYDSETARLGGWAYYEGCVDAKKRKNDNTKATNTISKT